MFTGVLVGRSDWSGLSVPEKSLLGGTRVGGEERCWGSRGVIDFLDGGVRSAVEPLAIPAG